MAVGSELLALRYYQLVVVNNDFTCIIVPTSTNIYKSLTIKPIIPNRLKKTFRIEHFLFGVEQGVISEKYQKGFN
ncbi:hypothetical protein [Dyadobacter sp. 32]|uniref:hypothetical protein n=1 Tax=Dyadobacter sp. 32 TaxID=538966 RepID=UPI0011ED9A4C